MHWETRPWPKSPRSNACACGFRPPRSSPALARQLTGIEIESLRTPADLARIPLLRKSDLPALQRENPPFAGIARSAWRFQAPLHVAGADFRSAKITATIPMARSALLPRAGVGAGDIVLNCFSYHLTPGAFIIESGAHALGCRDHPGGPGQQRTDDSGDPASQAHRLRRARRTT